MTTEDKKNFQNGVIVGAVAGGIKQTVVQQAVQSDYAQNDDTKEDYIKNRPCYDEEKTVDYIEYSVVTTEDFTKTFVTIDKSLNLTLGDTYSLAITAVSVGETDSNISGAAKDVRSVLEALADGETIIMNFDADVPSPLLGIESDETPYLISGISVDATSDAEENVTFNFHKNENSFVTITIFSEHPEKTFNAKITGPGITDKVITPIQLPSRYINWGDYKDPKHIKQELIVDYSKNVYETQPTIYAGNVNNLKENTVYFVHPYFDSANTTDNSKFILYYGPELSEDCNELKVDASLVFNVNGAFTKLPETILVTTIDKTANTVIFANCDNVPTVYSLSIPKNTKKLHIRLETNFLNYNLKRKNLSYNSDILPLDKYPNSTIALSNGSSLSDVVIQLDNVNNVIQNIDFLTNEIKSTVLVNSGGILDYKLVGIAPLIENSSVNITKINKPFFRGKVIIDVTITVAKDKKSYVTEGTYSSFCYDFLSQGPTTTNTNDLSINNNIYNISGYGKRTDNLPLFTDTIYMLLTTNQQNDSVSLDCEVE